MAFLDYVLQAPAYGWTDGQGSLVKPKIKQILGEFVSRLNVLLCLVPFFSLYLFKFMSPWTLLIGFLYSMIILGTHGTIWHHRYCTHGAYHFRNPFWRFFTQNLTISIIPEEIYVISHHVHHAKSDQPGDPYNAEAGFWYCFLADVNHQPIAKNLSQDDYNRVKALMKHTGVKANTYEQYLKWGSYVNPYRAVMSWILNWSFWYLMFYLIGSYVLPIGGHALACTFFGSAGFWAIGVRTFNYEGHGKGKDKKREGKDYNQKDNSINQLWPGFVAGEWHNNHHLFPKSARSGFKPHQVDTAWYYIKFMSIIGAVSSYKDSKKEFYKQYYTPYVQNKKKINKDEIVFDQRALKEQPGTP
jgi:fatty-acid desaturase